MPPAQRVSVRINEVIPDRRPLLAGRESHVRRGQYQGHNDEDPQEQGAGRTKGGRINPPLPTPRDPPAKFAHQPFSRPRRNNARQFIESRNEPARQHRHRVSRAQMISLNTQHWPTLVCAGLTDDGPRAAAAPPVQTIDQSRDRQPSRRKGGRASPSTPPSELAIQVTRIRGGGKRTRVQACDV